MEVKEAHEEGVLVLHEQPVLAQVDLVAQAAQQQVWVGLAVQGMELVGLVVQETE